MMGEWLVHPGGWYARTIGGFSLSADTLGAWSVVDGDDVRACATESGDTEAERLANAKAAAESWVRDFARGLLREVGTRDDGATLAAIRAALGCEPGGEVEAVRLVMDEHRRTIEAFAIATDVLDRVTVELGCVAGDDLVQAVQEVKDEGASARALLEAARATVYTGPPDPGDVLDPDDFGKGEAGVLRLAALLCEAPEGAAVSYMPEWGNSPVVLRKDGGCWDDSEGRLIFMWIARRAPLTVVAWPS